MKNTTILRWITVDRRKKAISRSRRTFTAAQFNQGIRDAVVPQGAPVSINIRPKTTCDWCGHEHTIPRG